MFINQDTRPHPRKGARYFARLFDARLAAIFDLADRFGSWRRLAS